MAARSTDPTGVSLTIKGLFASLPVSIYIGECFTFDQCSILWDNTHACCGSSIHFTVDATIVCAASQSAANYPIDHISLTGVTVDKLEITEKISGININVKDITDAVASKVSDVIKTYLTTKKFLPGPNSTDVTLVGYLNNNQMISQVASYLCNGPASILV